MATLKNGQKVAVAAIEVFGEKLVIPDGMKLAQAVQLIERRMEYEEQETIVRETYDCFPWDGAACLEMVLNERYGWSPAVPTPGFYSDNPPQLIAVEVGYGETRQVPWGRFMLPNVTGFVQTITAKQGKRVVFQLVAQIKRRDEETVRALFAAVKAKIKEASIYRGKAIRVEFLDEYGDEIETPAPTFLDTSAIDPSRLVLSAHLERAVTTSLFTPITRTADCIANGIAVKRGVLLGGIFGTGKTMIAHVASKLAVDHGITFLYLKRATELAHGIEFAKQYQSPACVIFVEDIDRSVQGERTAEMDQILNTIDGIDSKTSNIIVVLTTNALDKINPAMLRPGRLDAVLDITPPDGAAIQRLIKVYAGAALDPEADLVAVGKALEGNIPAVIAEVVKRAKLAQLSLQERGTKVRMLSSQALLDAALTIRAQVALLTPRAVRRPTLEAAFAEVVQEAMNGSKEAIQSTEKMVTAIHEKLS
jgi:SpoVK/Ycf46/Vps4 family AAA+-type ATPase